MIDFLVESKESFMIDQEYFEILDFNEYVYIESDYVVLEGLIFFDMKVKIELIER